MYPNLKLAIFRKGLQQNRVSRILGINEANLSKIIHGYREPSEAQRRLLANYLEADEAWLFEKYHGGGQSRLVSSSEHPQEDKDRELPQGNHSVFSRTVEDPRIRAHSSIHVKDR